jgi:SAM-dependent methyltransferase
MNKEEARRQADAIIHEHYRRGDPVGWFEAVYQQAGGDTTVIPWADLEPNPAVVEWFEREQIKAGGKSAVVIGCGLGDDAEYLAVKGYKVTAFDISPTAVAWCRGRFPQTQVSYQVADLFTLSPNWLFDLVVEVYTVQTLPVALRDRAISSVARLVETGGYLLAVGRFARSEAEQGELPPLPLTREELNGFTRAGLDEVQLEIFNDAETPPVRRFRALYRRST